MMRAWRIGSVGVLIFSLAVLWSGTWTTALRAAAPAPSAIATLPPTKVIVFHPAGTHGAVVAGACAMGESAALDRTDAWRCMVGNEIYDPCFSAAPHATTVICAATPTTPIGIKVQLAGPLPTHRPAHDTQAWILLLGDGTTCSFDTGGTFGINGQRANYGCSDKDWVIGDPATGRVWYAVKAHLSDKGSSNGPTASHVFAISIATVWK